MEQWSERVRRLTLRGAQVDFVVCSNREKDDSEVLAAASRFKIPLVTYRSVPLLSLSLQRELRSHTTSSLAPRLCRRTPLVVHACRDDWVTGSVKQGRMLAAAKFNPFGEEDDDEEEEEETPKSTLSSISRRHARTHALSLSLSFTTALTCVMW
jgi:hypothetical protein